MEVFVAWSGNREGVTRDNSTMTKISQTPSAHLKALEKTLEKYAPPRNEVQSKKSHKPAPGPTQPTPGPTPSPTGHLPGPNPGVVLPTLPGRPKGVTEMEAVITIDKYEGTIQGRNGTHEVALGHITLMNAVANKNVVDTMNVELALNVQSAKDGNGLPHEIPFKPGQQIEVEGEYIPASQANNHGNAVLHFSHSPLGYVITPDGQKFE